jgi:hypothetical protein
MFILWSVLEVIQYYQQVLPTSTTNKYYQQVLPTSTINKYDQQVRSTSTIKKVLSTSTTNKYYQQVLPTSTTNNMYQQQIPHVPRPLFRRALVAHVEQFVPLPFLGVNVQPLRDVPRRHQTRSVPGGRHVVLVRFFHHAPQLVGRDTRQTENQRNNEKSKSVRMEYNGRQWETMGDNGRQWETMGDNGRQWETMGDNSPQ